MSSDILSGQIALVSGATRGIGQAIALSLAKAGATVIGTATTDEGAQTITKYFKSHQLSGTGKRLDVTDVDQMTQALNEIKQERGAINILINNAGVTRDNLMLRMKEEEWQDVIDTNLTGVFRLTQLCLRDMLKARVGRIINIGSVVGTTGNPGQANYSASKSALLGFAKSLAHEVASRNITVNTVAPGYIETPMTSKLTEKQTQSILARIPMQRIGKPEEVAHAVLFLASSEASYITGHTLHVNGGMAMI
ncbi:MAG: 3-oxoacyl-[acyl-carrier-protein] reductase [Gammaproteobacteria bacterium RIFCSPHIGHO2_02_FULL_42_13]|nr:MAG: 3-oxoacyl-[acyl-carrier-protein] reductase [Gammaproteobacteria bacterium RIFCSPHIGHO2_02_FULL_42_13]OGT68560.1 MAG: 3-oxoacyl-[acyl-carrier-protein] reductase [Gammaproteobacteria bacterium RIFCSPLOWO2_02_FULL_42_9]